MNAETTCLARYHLTRILFARILASPMVTLFSKAGGKLIKRFGFHVVARPVTIMGLIRVSY
jgi:hypothetical protein